MTLRIAIGLGASIGDRRARLELTLRQIAAIDGVDLLSASRWYRSPPMRGGTATGWFLNGVAVVDSALGPDELLVRCRALEDRAGRRRARYWGDRTLDLDLLVAPGVTSDSDTLRLPHPGIADRPFVYWPLWEAWPALRPWLATLTPPTRAGFVPVGVPRVRCTGLRDVAG